MKDELKRLQEYAKKLFKEIKSINDVYGSYNHNGKTYDKYKNVMAQEFIGAKLDCSEVEWYQLDGENHSYSKQVCISKNEYLIIRLERCKASLEIMKDIHVKMSELPNNLGYVNLSYTNINA